MTGRGRALLAAVLLLLLATIAVLTLRLGELRERSAASLRRAEALADSLRAIQVRGRAPEAGADTSHVTSLLESWEVDELRRRGLDDPATQLLQDLARHPELVPERPVLGGTMRIWPSRSTVLSREWVYAYFEDGHIAGRGLFAYAVDDTGGIRWKRLDTRLD